MSAEYALPALNGRWIVIVRRCYIALAAIMLFLIAGNLISDTLCYFVYGPAVARYGFGTGEIDNLGPRVVPIWLRAGPNSIQNESRIIAVDGVALRQGDTFLDADEMIARGGPVLLLDVVDDRGRFSRHRLERGPYGASRIYPDENASVIDDAISLMVGEYLGDLVPFVISVILFRRRTRDPEAMLLAFAFLMMCTVGGNDAWPHAIGLSIGWVTHPLQTNLFLMGFSLMLAAICGFPDGRFTTRWAQVVAVSQILWGAYFAFAATFLPNFGHYHKIDVAVFSASLIALVLRHRQLPPGMERQQIKWALFGAVIMALTTGITLTLDLPGVASRLGPLHLFTDNIIFVRELAFPLGLFVSLMRFRLYDADNVIFRSAGFGGLTVALVAVFSAAEQITQSASQQYFGGSLGNWSAGIGAAAAAFTIGPLNKRIMHTIERRFRSKMVLLRDGLPLLLGEMRETATPQVLAEATLSRIEEGVHARCGAIVQGGVILALHEIGEGEVTTWLSSHSSPTVKRVREIERSDKLFPVRIALPGFHEREQGWLLLGPRPDGSLYPHEERETLSDAAEAIARSLAVAAKRRERDDRQDREIAALRQLTTSLQREMRRVNAAVANMRRGRRKGYRLP